MTPPHHSPSVLRSILRTLSLAALLLALLWQTPAHAQDVEPDAPTQASWLEPRGVNIIDLVGLVPDAHLAGGIISYETGTGMYIYNSGSRSGNTVTINATVVPRYFTFGANTYTQIGCISQHAAWDQWPSTAPATSLTLFSSGRNINDQITNLALTPAGQILPSGNAGDYLRYAKSNPNTVNAANPFPVPANNGCTIVLNGRFTDLTATIRATVPQQINVTSLGTQTFNSRSYIGPGSAGVLASLNSQMSRFGNRHDKFPMTIPATADYLLVKFAPTPIDPFAPVGNPANAGLPGSGSYRLEGSRLSVDHVSMIGLPLGGQWGDADQSGGAEFLPYFAPITRLAMPELFLPPGFPFNQCMIDGGCPDALLNQLNSFTFPVTAYYYRIDRLSGSALQRIPLRAVGKNWGAAAAVQEQSEIVLFAPEEVDAILQAGNRVWLPTVSNPRAVAPPTDDPTGCPCGWFDAQGRMFDFIPAP